MNERFELSGAELEQRLAAGVDAGDRGAVRASVASLEPLDTVHAVARLTDEQRATLLGLLRFDAAAEVLEHLPETQAGDALEALSPRRAARILGELPSDKCADLLNEVEDDEARAILATMAPARARDLRELASYEEDTAGGLMMSECVRVPLHSTVGEVVDHLQDNADTFQDFDVQTIYVEDPGRRLVGVLPMRELLFARRSAAVEPLMVREPATVPLEVGLDDLGAFFEEHRFFGVPVVDEAGVLRGVLRRRAVEAARAARREAARRASPGIVGGEELRSMPLLVRCGRRLSWLSVNIGLNVLAASVIALHQDTLEAVIALAVFLPIISDMSGCSGSQAMAVSMRELTLGVTRPRDLARVLLAEIKVGLVNGAALGALIGLVAWAWKGNPWLGAVVGAALAVNTVVAVCIGGAVPLALRRLGKDPALASGPILTTVTDMCGFFLVLTLASAALEYLG